MVEDERLAALVGAPVLFNSQNTHKQTRALIPT